MPINEEQTYLQLAPEFGGTKFGPFSGVEVRLGSDPTENDITLPEAWGIELQHVRILIQPDGSFIVAPTSRLATVYVFRGPGRPKQVTSPMAVASGDSFALATPEGPRFFILRELPPNAKKNESEGGGDAMSRARSRLSPASLFAEVRRVGFAKVFTSTLGAWALKAYTFVITGSIFQPRYIVMGVMIMSGWIMAGGASCGAVRAQMNYSAASGDLVKCEADRDQAAGISGNFDDQTTGVLAGSILGDTVRWDNTLREDQAFREAFVREHKKLRGQKLKRLNWVRNPVRSRDFQSFKKSLESAGLDERFTRVMAFAAAPENYIESREWTLVEDSTGERNCGRGPVLMTYRQAKNLSLEPVQPDALVDTVIALGSDIETKRTALLKTAGPEFEFVEDEVETTGVGPQGVKQCMFISGDDSRTNSRALAGMISSRFGANGARVPEMGEEFWQLARIMSFYAADADLGYGALDFRADTPPSVTLDDLTGAQRDYVIDASAKLVARAVATYCAAALDSSTKVPDYLEPLPGPIGCLALNWRVDEE